MAMQHTQFFITLGRAAHMSKEIVVKAEFPMDWNVRNEVATLARKAFAAEVLCEQGRYVGERTETITALYRAATRANAFTFMDSALQLLSRVEDSSITEFEKATDLLMLYRFERVFGPPVFLALHPSKRGAEAYAILAGNEIIEEDDNVDENELAEVQRTWAENMPIDGESSLWQKFSQAEEPCYLAAAPSF